MFQYLTLVALLLPVTQSQANSTSNDFGRSDSQKEILTSAEIRDRFELHGEIFVTDKDGKLLYQGAEIRMWKFGKKKDGQLISNWSFHSPAIKEIALQHIWTLSDDGKIKAHLKQFDSMKMKDSGNEVKTGKLIREEKMEIKDFSPVIWLAHSDEKERVVVRLIPKLGDKEDFVQIDALPLTLDSPVVFDNKGGLWAYSEGSLEGRYTSITTHLGQLAMSYTPFKGAKEIGFVKDNRVTIDAGKDIKLFVQSKKSILATSKSAKIYGIVKLNRKTHSRNSIHFTSSDKEENFLKGLK